MLISQLATQRKHTNGEFLELSFVDVKKAYFNGIPRRRLHLFMPKEMGLGNQAVGLLKKCVYGTKDAGMSWEDMYARTLASLGFKRGLANPCCFDHPTTTIRRRSWG